MYLDYTVIVYQYTVECCYNAVRHNIAYITAVTEVENKSEFETTKVTPYLAVTGELWGVFSTNFGENWQFYNGTALYCDKLVYHNSALTLKWGTNFWSSCQ